MQSKTQSLKLSTGMGRSASASYRREVLESNTQLMVTYSETPGPAYNLQSYKGIGMKNMPIKMKFSGREDKRVERSPAPNQYLIKNDIVRKSSPAVSMTNSSGTYIDKIIQNAPEIGPGQYNTQRSTLKDTGCTVIKDPSGAKVLRHPTPCGQDYTDKEKAYKLTMQKEPHYRLPDPETANKIHLKRFVGPSIEYNQQVTCLKQFGAGGFCKQGLYRQGISDNGVPGPGSYNVTDKMHLKSTSQRAPGFSFNSRRAKGLTL